MISISIYNLFAIWNCSSVGAEGTRDLRAVHPESVQTGVICAVVGNNLQLVLIKRWWVVGSFVIYGLSLGVILIVTAIGSLQSEMRHLKDAVNNRPSDGAKITPIVGRSFVGMADYALFAQGGRVVPSLTGPPPDVSHKNEMFVRLQANSGSSSEGAFSDAV